MKIIENLSPNHSDRKEDTKINSIVLHYTGMRTSEAALQRMKDPEYQVSSHYFIDMDGSIQQLVPEEFKAWHAGKSWWRHYENLNENSIGIEIANPGHEHGYKKFTGEQLAAAMELCSDIIARNPGIEQRNIVGHSDIAPNRKEDPGELFPWKVFANNGIGIYHTINYGRDFHYRQPSFYINEENKAIGEVQRKLAAIGYRIQRSASLDEPTKNVIAAFYRRYIPERISLSPNARYPQNIRWDALSDIILNDLFQKFNY